MRRVQSIIYFVAFVLTGCAYFAPAPVSVGPCVLVVLDDGPIRLQLQRPYRVRQYKVRSRPGSQEKDAQADITYRGTGWQDVHMTITDPAGVLRVDEDVPGVQINEGGMGDSLDMPGLWRERLQDDTAGCTQEFSVEVLPPTG